MEFLESLTCPTMSSANEDTLASPFLSISFSCLTTLTNTILNRYGESGQFGLALYFSGISLNFSPFNLMLVMGLMLTAFILLRWPLYP